MTIKNSLHHRSLNRRNFLGGSLAGAASLSLRSLATGLPASFLLTGQMPAYAQSTSQKTLILAMSDDGESVNSYAPGTYSTDSNDPRFAIERATETELGTDVKGSINGNNVQVGDFTNSATFDLGDTTVQGAKYFSYLPQSLRERMAFFHIRTAANGHPEGGRVHGVNGALVGGDGRGVEEIQSAIMQEMAVSDSVLTKPMVLNGGGGRLAVLSYGGAALTRYTPIDVKNLFLSSNSVEIENMNKVYENAIDSIYKTVKSTGTSAQREYLDAHAASRGQAVILGDQLGDLLSSVTGSSRGDQIKAAVGMAKAKLSPVIVVRYAYCGDNHGDANLATEVSQSIEQMNNLESLWSLIQAEGMEDQINYATYDIFGRTLGRNNSGGRDHHNSSCVNMMIGSNIKAGVIGGLEDWSNGGHRLMRAMNIDSATGAASSNGDISADETLSSYARTLMASMGISEERIDFRIKSGKTITGALT